MIILLKLSTELEKLPFGITERARFCGKAHRHHFDGCCDVEITVCQVVWGLAEPWERECEA
jgi:hypothetical protein